MTDTTNTPTATTRDAHTGGRAFSDVYLDVDGQPVPVRELFWTVFAPCGCLEGAMVVDRGNGDVLLTVDQARSSMLSGIRVLIERDIEDGFTYRLMRNDEFKATPFGGCEHDPKWGVAKVEPPEGNVWATSDRWHTGRRTHVRHIVAGDGLGDWHTDPGTAICGRKPARFNTWSVDKEDLHDTVTCRKCEAAARILRGES